MYTATSYRILPTTVTGSWPRPTWYTGNLLERPYSTALGDVQFREQHMDAVATVISDQELAGLDILTNGDFHLDADLGGRSWFSYPSERISGTSEYDTERTALWDVPGRHLDERDRRRLEVPAVIDKSGRACRSSSPRSGASPSRAPSSRSSSGPFSADLACTVLDVQTDVYDDDKRELMWDIAEIINAELRQLAAAGCKVIQIEEPAIHSAAAYGADGTRSTSSSTSSTTRSRGSTTSRSGLHTCWGNPGAAALLRPGHLVRAVARDLHGPR